MLNGGSRWALFSCCHRLFILKTEAEKQEQCKWVKSQRSLSGATCVYLCSCCPKKLTISGKAPTRWEQKCAEIVCMWSTVRYVCFFFLPLLKSALLELNPPWDHAVVFLKTVLKTNLNPPKELSLLCFL